MAIYNVTVSARKPYYYQVEAASPEDATLGASDYHEASIHDAFSERMGALPEFRVDEVTLVE